MTRMNRRAAAGPSDASALSGRSIQPGAAATSSESSREGYRLRSNGRFVSNAERIAAAKARVTADSKRNVTTEDWIIDLARQAS